VDVSIRRRNKQFDQVGAIALDQAEPEEEKGRVEEAHAGAEASGKGFRAKGRTTLSQPRGQYERGQAEVIAAPARQSARPPLPCIFSADGHIHRDLVQVSAKVH